MSTRCTRRPRDRTSARSSSSAGFPGIVLAVGKDRPFKSHADLKGMKIGVTAPGSSSHFFVLYLMAKAGLAPTDATFVGVGGGPAAVDAMKAGEIDAISNLDPVITRLQAGRRHPASSPIRRFPRVNYEIFGGTNPAAVLYAKQEFIAANPNTMQALVTAFYKTLKWIATATTDEIVDTVPSDYFLGDRAIYVKALKANLLVYSKTGMITRQGMNSALNMLATFDPELKGAKIDLQKNLRRSIHSGARRSCSTIRTTAIWRMTTGGPRSISRRSATEAIRRRSDKR